MASDGDLLWVKDLTEAQLQSIELQSIPYKKTYYLQENLLFPQGEKIPERKLPSLLWSPIDKFITVELPSGNYNFFGLTETLELTLIPAGEEQPATAMMCAIGDLQTALEELPAVRLEPLRWSVLKKHFAIIIGTPLLPIKGFTYWRKGDMLIPTGYRFDLEILCYSLQQKLDPEARHLILWNKEGAYTLLPKQDFATLSLSSFRKTVF